jgi:4-amino-4-deoxy-L-arabinose transferase-like glycosyltransferase
VVVPRIIWISIIDVVPKSDFKTYHLVASSLANGEIVLNKYISVFPHVIGYPYILSFFYKIFGNEIIVAQIVNMLFSYGVALLIFLIGNMFMRKRYSLISVIIWALWPSQIFYSVLIISETLYTFLMLLFIYCFLKVTQKATNKKIYFFIFFLLGILCSICNAIRPFGLVLIIACAIYYFIIINKNVKYPFKFKKKFILFIILIMGYTLFSSFITYAIKNKIELEPSKSPIGFNLYVGVNYNSKGQWNIHDSEKFGELIKNENYSAQDVHDIFFDKAVLRIKENGINNFKLLIDKATNMWSEDTDAIKYIKGAINPQNKSILNFPKYYSLFSKVSILYYYIIIMLSITGCIKLFKTDISNTVYFLLIILWGIIGVHLIVEVAGRYHYFAIIIFSMIAPLSLIKKRRIIV